MAYGDKLELFEGVNNTLVTQNKERAITIGNAASVAADSLGNTSIQGPTGGRIGVGSGYKSILRRLELNSFLYNGSLVQAPAWAALTAYSGATPSYVVRLPGGQLIGVVNGGTSGGSAPTFNGAALISDGTVTWGSIGKISKLQSAREIPTIAVATAPPAGTTAAGVAPAVVGFICNGYPGLLVTCSNGIGAYSQAGNGQVGNTPGVYLNGSNSLFQGITGLKGWGAGGTFEFISDAPAIGFNMTNQGITPYYLYVGDIDGRNMCLVEEGDSVAAGTNPYWRNYVWPEGRALRRYRLESNGSNGSQQLAVTQLAINTQDVLYPAPLDGVRGLFITDSFGNTASPVTNGGSAAGWTIGQLALKMAGVRYANAATQSGAGYASGSTSWQGSSTTAQIPLLFQNDAFNPSVVLSGIPTFGTPVKWIPDVVVFAAGFNDVASSSSAIAANALYSFQQARVQWPNALIIVFGPQPGAHNNSAGQIAAEAAILTAYSQWGDVNSAWFPVTGDPNGPWVTGAGSIGSLTGVGNSDFYTGSDGTHPPSWGHYYLARKYATYIDIALTAKGL